MTFAFDLSSCELKKGAVDCQALSLADKMEFRIWLEALPCQQKEGTKEKYGHKPQEWYRTA
eukprot:1798748-Amphidinium_carterae.1